MSALMTTERATRTAIGAGVTTFVFGAALVAAPERVGPVGGLVDPKAARLIGIADLVLVPGLVAGRARGPWMAARAALNVAIVAYGRRLARAGTPRIGVVACAVSAITVVDAAAAVVLLRAESRGAGG
ncbi:hypothetical protein DSM112329_02539 [Paraconexibacter sp. AEG42_29]|uniref:DUF4267 domain-containing protein n=1 Tax=Paraconexibacter sp. AEG42_29 TaxID=2997339 RepID=A0AAU7AWH2_9ACTN